MPLPYPQPGCLGPPNPSLAKVADTTTAGGDSDQLSTMTAAATVHEALLGSPSKESESAELVLVQNWFEELERRLPR